MANVVSGSERRDRSRSPATQHTEVTVTVVEPADNQPSPPLSHTEAATPQASPVPGANMGPQSQSLEAEESHLQAERQADNQAQPAPQTMHSPMQPPPRPPAGMISAIPSQQMWSHMATTVSLVVNEAQPSSMGQTRSAALGNAEPTQLGSTASSSIRLVVHKPIAHDSALYSASVSALLPTVSKGAMTAGKATSKSMMVRKSCMSASMKLTLSQMRPREKWSPERPVERDSHSSMPIPEDAETDQDSEMIVSVSVKEEEPHETHELHEPGVFLI